MIAGYSVHNTFLETGVTPHDTLTLGNSLAVQVLTCVCAYVCSMGRECLIVSPHMKPDPMWSWRKRLRGHFRKTQSTDNCTAKNPLENVV